MEGLTSPLDPSTSSRAPQSRPDSGHSSSDPETSDGVPILSPGDPVYPSHEAEPVLPSASTSRYSPEPWTQSPHIGRSEDTGPGQSSGHHALSIGGVYSFPVHRASNDEAPGNNEPRSSRERHARDGTSESSKANIGDHQTTRDYASTTGPVLTPEEETWLLEPVKERRQFQLKPWTRYLQPNGKPYMTRENMQDWVRDNERTFVWSALNNNKGILSTAETCLRDMRRLFPGRFAHDLDLFVKGIDSFKERISDREKFLWDHQVTVRRILYEDAEDVTEAAWISFTNDVKRLHRLHSPSSANGYKGVPQLHEVQSKLTTAMKYFNEVLADKPERPRTNLCIDPRTNEDFKHWDHFKSIKDPWGRSWAEAGEENYRIRWLLYDSEEQSDPGDSSNVV